MPLQKCRGIFFGIASQIKYLENNYELGYNQKDFNTYNSKPSKNL